MAKRCKKTCTDLQQQYRGLQERWLSTGEGKWVVGLGCLVQRLTVYTVATVNSHLPIALDNQPANLCSQAIKH